MPDSSKSEKATGTPNQSFFSSFTFLCDGPTEFTPRLNQEHSAYIWVDPAVPLLEARAEKPEPEIDPRLAKVIADNVEALGARLRHPDHRRLSGLYGSGRQPRYQTAGSSGAGSC